MPPSAFGSVVFAIGAWMGNRGWRGGHDHRLSGSGRATVHGRLAARRWQAVARLCAHLDGQVGANDYAERLGVREVDVAIERGLEFAIADPFRKGVRLPPANRHLLARGVVGREPLGDFSVASTFSFHHFLSIGKGRSAR